MKKQFLYSILLSSQLLMNPSFASKIGDGSEELVKTTRATTMGFSDIFIKNLTNVAKKAGVKTGTKHALKIAESYIPGSSVAIGAMYFYSGTEADKAKYKGTLARQVGKNVHIWIKELGGEFIVKATDKFKPADADTLTEAVFRALSRKFASVRTKSGVSALFGDTAQGAIKYIPYAGSLIAASTKSVGQYIDPEARSLTEATIKKAGAATEVVMKKASTLVNPIAELDLVGSKGLSDFMALPNKVIRKKVFAEFNTRLTSGDEYELIGIYSEMISRYKALDKPKNSLYNLFGVFG